MERNQFITLLSRTAEQGAAKALALCPAKPQAVSKSQAYRLYGRSDIDRWLAEGLITLHDNRLDTAALARIAAGSNRITYLSANQRKNR